MDLPETSMLLRVFVGEAQKADGKPLYAWIVNRARELHLAGATVLRGPMGYGHSSRIRRASMLELSEDLPVIVEIVDVEAKIRAFLPELDSRMTSGLVTIETVTVVRYGLKPDA